MATTHGAAPLPAKENTSVNSDTSEKQTESNKHFPRYGGLIGATPLVDVTHLAPKGALAHSGTKVLAKCEFLNPGYSIKDRIAVHIIQSALGDGSLQPGGTIVAASSGNTGAAVAMVAAQVGHPCVIITSPKCSAEKMDAIVSYGATLLVSPPGCPEGDPNHYMEIETRLAGENEGWFSVNQYENKKNSEAHYLTLGPEIWEQTDGKVTHFVAGGSTGGTVSGVGRSLKEKSGDRVHVTIADPVGSVLSEAFGRHEEGHTNDPGDGLKASKFHVEGVGKGSVPGVMEFEFVDSAVSVTDQQSFDMCHRLSSSEGMLVGGSGGLNVFAALRLAESVTGPDGGPALIVTVCPDSGIKYLSKVFNSEWLKGQGFPGVPETNRKVVLPDSYKSMVREA
jgi:cysteine synthase